MNKLTLKIIPDDDPINPRTEYDNLGHMVCSHRRYILGDATPNIDFDKFNSWDHVEKYLQHIYEAAVILPLYLYDHSGLTMATTPFSCRWDSGQVGFIYVTRQEVLDEAPGNPKRLTKRAREWATKLLEGEVETYDQYQTGNVF